MDQGSGEGSAAHRFGVVVGRGEGSLGSQTVADQEDWQVELPGDFRAEAAVSLDVTGDESAPVEPDHQGPAGTAWLAAELAMALFRAAYRLWVTDPGEPDLTILVDRMMGSEEDSRRILR